MKLIQKFSNRYTLIALLIIYGVFAAIIMPSSAAQMDENAVAASGPLDLLFSYSPQTAFAHIESYGEQGRAAYIKFSLIVDTAYPIVYTLLFIVIIYLLAVRLWPKRPKLHRLALVPIAAFIFDLCENQSIVAMLKSYPKAPENIAKIGSIFTSLKWISVGASFTVILVLLCLWLARVLRKKTPYTNVSPPD